MMNMSKKAGLVEVQTSSVIWKIDEFSKKCKVHGEYIQSPNFEFNDSKKKTYWTLDLYPYGNTLEDQDYMSIFLTFLSQSTISECEISLEISLLCGVRTDASTLKSHTKVKFNRELSLGYRKFIKRSQVYNKENTLLKQDTLTILCSISLLPINNKIYHVVSSLSDQYKSLFMTGDFSDVTIVIGDKNIKAHKAILSARSKVFSAMLKHDMTEMNTNVITITDVEVTVMEKFVLFLYSGEIDDIKKFAKSLLPVANKYDVQELKQLCENSLFDGLTIDNACELVCMADLYSCLELKSKIIDYMVENMSKIIKTKGFHDLSSSIPTFLKEIFCKFVEFNSNKNQ